MQIAVNRSIQILLVYLFVVNVSEGLLSPLLAVFVVGSIAGATLKTVGFAVGLYAIAKSIVQIPLARKMDRRKGERDDFFVMMLGAVLTTLYTFGYLFITVPWQLYVLTVFGGIGGACLMAAYYGIYARHVDKGAEGFEWSLFSVGGLTLALGIGSVIGGVFTDAYGFPALFFTAGIINALATVFLALLYPYLDVPKRPAVESGM